jgi:hypothetical protein
VKQVDNKVGRLEQEIVFQNKIQESTDVILKRPWERAEQTQLQTLQDKAATENMGTLVERLGSQVVELRELVLSGSSNSSVPCSPKSAAESVSSEPLVNGQITTGVSSGSVNGNVGEDVNSVDSTNRPPTVNSGLSIAELPFPLIDENLGINPRFHLKQLDEFVKLKEVYHKLVNLR